jgi:DNA excision repair protein ERCC-2
MYAAQRDLGAADTVCVALTYVNIETDEYTTFREAFRVAALEGFFLGILDKYLEFAELNAQRTLARNRTAAELAFPYETYRPGQRELAVAVYTVVKKGAKLFVQAPTGIGKTMSALFPAVKALAAGRGEKIFYLTAKTSTRRVAEDAMRRMGDAGLTMRSITLTARDAICFREPRACDPDCCEYANGHFDRVNAAILDCVANETLITRGVVEAYARKHRVCPAEYALDVALFCDVVVCDYNHAYDPKARLRRFFTNGGDFILLNDEAHNLVDRAREMFSAELRHKDFNEARREMTAEHPLRKPLGAAARAVKDHYRDRVSKEPFSRAEKPELLPGVLMELVAACDTWFKKTQGTPPDEALLTLYFGALDYLRVNELYNEHYTTYCEPERGYIRLFCLNPAELLAKEQAKSRACVFFSATLAPMPYFRALLGGSASDYAMRLASPFDRRNLCLMLDTRVSTRFKDRFEENYREVAGLLREFVGARAGNYMAFFPSSAYLREVAARFREDCGDVELLEQTREMGAEEREAFLANFKTGDKKTLLGLVVLGGAFAEGIDLAGERLIGAAVVGVGLPKLSPERAVIAKYFENNGENGFNYAYLYPGMNKVLQAAGRVIRTDTDRGAVLLIDERYDNEEYSRLFPPEWAGYERLGARRGVGEILKAFWGGEGYGHAEGYEG